MLKVSVITVTYNSKDQLKLSLDALKKQDYSFIESIIIDGGSTDGTIEVIQKFEQEFQGKVKWISERDHGIYNAINKGIRMATGDMIGIYNDLFCDISVISSMVKKVQEEHTDGVCGDLVYVGENGKIIRYWKTGIGTIQKGWMPGTPTLYLKKKVFETYGLYDEGYRCSGDFEFTIRVFQDKKVKLSYIPKVLVQMFYGGTSTSGFQAYWISIKESYLALYRNHVRFALFVLLLRIFKTSAQFIRKPSKEIENIG